MLRMFRKLCGSDSLKNMRIVTGFWSKEVTIEEQNRERQMQTDDRFFKLFLDDGAQMIRHDNTIESAHNIIRGICKNSPSALDIQLDTGLARHYNELKNLQALTHKKVDVVQVWSSMDSKARIVAVFRRSVGMENDPGLNDFWATLGDTINFFRDILAFFEEYPLPLAVHDQLLGDNAVLTHGANEKFDKWLLDNHEEVGVIEEKVKKMVATGGYRSLRKKKEGTLAKVGARIMNRLRGKRSSPKP